jgi:hypothetical protein
MRARKHEDGTARPCPVWNHRALEPSRLVLPVGRTRSQETSPGSESRKSACEAQEPGNTDRAGTGHDDSVTRNARTRLGPRTEHEGLLA